MFLAPSLFFAAVVQTTAIDVDLYFAGAKAGTNHYEGKPGQFDSVTKLNLQGLDIDSRLAVTFTDGKPVTLSFEESMKQVGKVLRQGSVTVKNGKATISSNGIANPKEMSVTLEMPMFANFHPQASQLLYGSVKWDQKTKQEISAFLVEGLGKARLSITPKDKKTITTSDGTIIINNAEVVLGNVTFTLAFDDKGGYVGMDVPSQKLKMVRRGYEEAFEDPLAKFKELSQATYESKVEVIDIPMRDGITTKATLVRPDKPGKYPVILSRTPYNRLMATDEGHHYAVRGYAFIVQDVRGTGESKGAFDPMVNERKDGYDTIDWISKQDWCDGNVGMIGASYVGFVQWAAAVEHHPALKCLVPQVSPPSSAMWNIPYENGVFTLLSDLWWLRIVDNPKGQNMLEALGDITNMKGLMTLPLDKTDDKMLGFNSKLFTEWLKRDTSAKWPGWHFDDLMPTVKIPALHISGWFDGDEIGTQRNWKFVTGGGNTQQWLIYGPWTHFFNTTSKLANVDFGKDAILELDSLYLRWFDTWLKGKDVGINKVPKVRYFTMGENKWHESTSWPPAESKEETLKFEFAKVNNGPKSAAKLVSVLKKDTLTKSVYDPSKDTISTDSMKVSDEGQDAFIKTSAITKDQIMLRSAPFDRDRLLTGPVTVEFDFKSSAKDTDFYALAFDEYPDKGHLVVFRTGKLKASYLQGLDKQRFLTPGKTYRAKLQLWDGANLFKKGHRLSLMILHSQFPGTARNLGTTDPILTGKKMVVQNNVIFSQVKSPGLIRFRVID